MEKTKKYKYGCFNADIIKSAFEKCLLQDPIGKEIRGSFRLERGEESWEYDDEQEFFADYRKEHDSSIIRKSNDKISIRIAFDKFFRTSVSVNSNSRGEIESIFEIFEKNYPESIKEPSKEEKKGPVIFIGHGRSPQWRDLKDHLADKHDYKIEAYETGARAGHTIRDILEEMSSKSSFALLVMTGEDKDDSGNLRARQNVIHEVGLFQGKLGYSRAIVLLEEGTEEFSNLFGVQQVRFSKENIKETFGEVLATLKREFEL